MSAPPADLGGVHELFWAVRHDPRLAGDFAAKASELLRDFEVDPRLHAAVTRLDVRTLYEAGVNPYLLFFAAVELGLSRDEYYRRISAGGDDG